MLKTVGKRLISGGGIGAAWAVALLFLPPWGLFAGLLLCSALVQWEFYNLVRRGGYETCRETGVLLGTLWLVAVFAFPTGGAPGPLAGDRWEGLLAIGGGVVLLSRLLFDSQRKKPLEEGAFTLLGIFYGPFMLSYYIRLAQAGSTGPFALTRAGVFLAFYVSLVVKMSDVGGYVVGMKLGKRKMFPRISPAKSWEGLAGGLLLSAVASVAVVAVAHNLLRLQVPPLRNMNYGLAAGLGVLLGGIGVLGDLVESMFKRAVHVKDSSGILPGVGGLLDVFDSLLFAPAFLYFVMPWL